MKISTKTTAGGLLDLVIDYKSTTSRFDLTALEKGAYKVNKNIINNLIDVIAEIISYNGGSSADLIELVCENYLHPSEAITYLKELIKDKLWTDYLNGNKIKLE